MTNRPKSAPKQGSVDLFNPKTGAFALNIRDVDGGDDSELRESMKKFGWIPEFPALVDENDVPLVGHRRLKIAKEENIAPVIKKLTLGNGDAGDAARLKLAIASNIGFKPMSKEDRKRIAECLYGRHEWTMERIAEALNVSHQTIGRDLADLSTMDKSHREKSASNPKGAGRPKGSGRSRRTKPEPAPTLPLKVPLPGDKFPAGPKPEAEPEAAPQAQATTVDPAPSKPVSVDPSPIQAPQEKTATTEAPLAEKPISTAPAEPVTKPAACEAPTNTVTTAPPAETMKPSVAIGDEDCEVTALLAAWSLARKSARSAFMAKVGLVFDPFHIPSFLRLLRDDDEDATPETRHWQQ